MERRRVRIRSGPALRIALASLLGAAPVQAEPLVAEVVNARGDAVQHAVVYATDLDPAGDAAAGPTDAVIDQVDKEFVPYVTAVQVGTRVRFPNRDQIRHHVYSFSEAKTFEIPLYKGLPPQPVEFDAPGDVALGCNIHDWMRAYVFVSETPHFDVTDEAGRATLDVPAGRYRVEVWHPELDGEPAETARTLEVEAEASREVRFEIEQRRVWRPRRAPSLADPSYR